MLRLGTVGDSGFCKLDVPGMRFEARCGIDGDAVTAGDAGVDGCENCSLDDLRVVSCSSWGEGVIFIAASPQLAARSPNTEAMPHNPLFLGGIGGLLVSGCTEIFGGGKAGTSSSQIFSMMPVRTKDQSEHVVRKRVKHQLPRQRG